MSIKLMSLIWQDHTGELTGIEKAILIKMADYAADNGTQIFPSVKTLALDTAFSEKTVRRAINTLIEKKRLTKTIRSRKAVHISNLYRINTAALQQAAPVNKPVNKRGITKEGTPSQSVGVLPERPEGTPSQTSNPPPNHHIDPPLAKDTINCLKNEQQEPSKQSPSKIPLADKKKIIQDMAKLLKQTTLKR